MLNKNLRKTRKFPDMFGSSRKRKKDLRFAKRFDNWVKLYNCNACVSEPICINAKIV